MDRLLKLVERVTIIEKRALVRSFLKRDEVGLQMGEMGLAQEELDASVTTLTDAELLEIAEKIERIPDRAAKEKAAGALGSAADIAIVVLLFLILMSI